jgi:hypothetical protein
MPSTVLNEQEIQQMKSSIMSDNTAFMRWSTEIEYKKDVVESDFLKRNQNLILFIDKFTPMANFRDKRIVALHKLKFQDSILERNAGLNPSAEETAISAIDDIQLSRGENGFFQEALITQRHELQEERKTDSERRVSFFNRVFSKKPQNQQQQGSGGPQQ